MKKPTTLLIILLLLAGCGGIDTTDPKEAYEYWTGTKPPSGLNVIQGCYWQSAHWTKEYILYLKLKPTEKWWKEFVEQNQLQIDHKDWTKPSDAPPWFNPTENTVRYSYGDSVDQGSRYFQDTLTGECYIYEIQL